MTRLKKQIKLMKHVMIQLNVIISIVGSTEGFKPQVVAGVLKIPSSSGGFKNPMQ